MTDTIKNIRIEDYSYVLPYDRIAQFPARKRDDSKLLIYQNDQVSHDNFHTISNYITKPALLIFNNSKVIRARLHFKKKSGAQIEIFCLEPHEPAEYNQAFCATNHCQWKCLIGNAKKWKDGPIYLLQDGKNKHINFKAHLVKKETDSNIVQFFWDDQELSFGKIIRQYGQIPLPPYISRNPVNDDYTRYQTIFSKPEGSVAAPTAGLHFSKEIMESFKRKEIETAEITLHVGAGTFKPVKSETIGNHEMHTEHFSVDIHALKKILSMHEHLVVVGTTSVRTLESLYWMGVKLLTADKSDRTCYIDQWEPYYLAQDIPVTNALTALIEFCEKRHYETFDASTRIMIVPGYRFRLTKKLVTNFHQPGSTLLLLVAALIGQKWKEVYQYALDNEFRFLSYGDSSLLIP